MNFTEVAIPPLCTAAGLWLARAFYFWQRTESFKRREKRRRDDPAEVIEIPVGTKKAEDFGVSGVAVHKTEWQFLPKAVNSQGRYFANGVTAAILPPFALLLLSVQILAFPNGGAWATGFALAETGYLGLLVCLAWSQAEPTAEWEKNRIRTELLRREQYLVVAGVGPYLGKTDCEVEVQAQSRLGKVKGASAASLSDLMDLRDAAGPSWLDMLLREKINRVQVRDDLADRIKTYVYMRISKQLAFFANESRDCGGNEKLWTRLLKAATISALIVAILHLSHLLGSLGGSDPITTRQLAITAVGVVLPPVGTALLGIQSMYAFGFRRRLYRRTESRLQEYRGVAVGLLGRVEALKHANAAQWQEAELDFRVLVLNVEQVLSFELEQWHLLMSREEFDSSP